MTLFYEFGACLNILFTQMLAAKMLIASDIEKMQRKLRWSDIHIGLELFWLNFELQLFSILTHNPHVAIAPLCAGWWIMNSNMIFFGRIHDDMGYVRYVSQKNRGLPQKQQVTNRTALGVWNLMGVEASGSWGSKSWKCLPRCALVEFSWSDGRKPKILFDVW